MCECGKSVARKSGTCCETLLFVYIEILHTLAIDLGSMLWPMICDTTYTCDFYEFAGFPRNVRSPITPILTGACVQLLETGVVLLFLSRIKIKISRAILNVSIPCLDTARRYCFCACVCICVCKSNWNVFIYVRIRET